MNTTERLLRVATRIRADVPLALLDAVLVVAAFMLLLFVRFDGDLPALGNYSNRMSGFLPVIIVVHLVANWGWGLYGPMWRHASVAEARRILLAGLTAGAAVFLINPLTGFPVPRSINLVGAAGATGLMGLARFQTRLFGSRRQADRTATRVAVVGAGDAGATIVREMLQRPDNGRTPVVVVDDDTRKQGRLLLGVPVVGDIAHLDVVLREYDADEVLVAIPSANQELLNRIMHGADLADVPLKTLPPVRDLLGAAPTVRDARDLRIEDLLGRTQVPIDIHSIKATMTDCTVLITGAGGSIGSEIVNQVARCTPGRLVLIDHDETHLHDASSALRGFAGRAELVLADIRDAERMFELFAEMQPEVVFHAAAHKNVPLLEAHPCEAVRTNVLGTRNVVDAAAATGVGRLVFISTDKAVRPTNNLGYSKWLGEQLVLQGMHAGARWCSVRFGNVLGSRGSVIPTFARQIADGGPVTVTDPRMTRFFMSVPEACQLVLQAATMAEGGEIFMLDMGEPVNILELAERMVRLSGHQVGTEIPVHFIGRRPGEKLQEDLHDPDETASPTIHPSIVRLMAARISGKLLDHGTQVLNDFVSQRRDSAAAAEMVRLVTVGSSSSIAAEGPVTESSPDAVSTRYEVAVEPLTSDGAPVPERREPWSRSTT